MTQKPDFIEFVDTAHYIGNFASVGNSARTSGSFTEHSDFPQFVWQPSAGSHDPRLHAVVPDFPQRKSRSRASSRQFAVRSLREPGRVPGWVGALRRRRPWAAERSDGREQSETRAGLESSNADADPPVIWGRLHACGSNPHAHPCDPPG